MSEKDFLRSLRRGLGGAILELQNNPARAKYSDAVLRCCLKDISFDIQCEGSKGYYLYTAICALGQKDIFEDVLADAYTKRLPYNLFQQLTDILRMYACDGSQKSAAALTDKYNSFLRRLPKQRAFPLRYKEQAQFEYLMISRVDAYGWHAFKQCVEDAGAVITARKGDPLFYYDWFVGHCQNTLGTKRVQRYLTPANATSPATKAFAGAYARLEESRKKAIQKQQEAKSTITLKIFLTHARQPQSRPLKYDPNSPSPRSFSKQASPADLRALADAIKAEPSDTVKHRLLQVFQHVDFPDGPTPLLGYAHSDSAWLSTSSITALERFKDTRIHALAIQLIENDELWSGLPLLINNWHKTDEVLLRRKILASKKVDAQVQSDIINIYTKHHSNSCGDILQHLYQNGKSGFLRHQLVEVMAQNHVLPDALLQECRFDFYDDTRVYAEKIIHRQEKSKANIQL